MSRAEVRLAAVNYFTKPPIRGLSRVYRSWPYEALGQDFFAKSLTSKHGAIAALFIEQDSEERRASGAKLLRYNCRLDVWHQSRVMDAEAAMDSYDGIIETIKTRLRTDHQFARPDIILQAAEGTEQITAEHGEPSVVEQSVQIWGAVRFQVQQWLVSL